MGGPIPDSLFPIPRSSCPVSRPFALLPQHRHHPGDVPAHGAELHGVLDRLRGGAEPQVELLLGELRQLGPELLHRLLGEVVGLEPLHEESSSRLTKRVLTGSLAEASANDSRASCSGTPSTSNRIRPGFTTATQP